MTRIGIITIVKVNNYGAELQAFALEKELQRLGFDAEIIDYLYYKNWRYKDSKLSKAFLKQNNKQKILYWIKYRLINFSIDCVCPFFNKAIKQRIQRFAAFHKKNTKFSKEFTSMPDLYKNYPQYDIYMVGSDQVWNPFTSSSIEPYFLTFASKDKKKIAYASSFGVSSIPELLEKQYSKLLNNLDHISVREQSGVNLVKQLINKDAKLVLDPTLLLNKTEWSKVMNPYPKMPTKYILIYQLSDSQAIVNLALRIGKEYNLKVYRICKRAYANTQNKGIINILDAGPAEFLSLIHNATYVITNSFHGTAFSINFNIPFYSIISAKKTNNSRLESLLNVTQLNSRLIKDNVVTDSINISNNIDFTIANEQLNLYRNQSIQYIIDSIEN